MTEHLAPFGTRVPHPLERLAERLGRSPGRRPLPSVFEEFLHDQLARERLSADAHSALLASRDVVRHLRRREPARRPDL